MGDEYHTLRAGARPTGRVVIRRPTPSMNTKSQQGIMIEAERRPAHNLYAHNIEFAVHFTTVRVLTGESRACG